MEDNKQNEPLQPIIDQFSDYFETYIRLAGYRALKKGTSLMAGIVTDVFIVLALAMTFLFISLTMAFFLSHVFGAYWEGFGCVTLFYLLIVLLIILFRDKLERPIINALLKRIFK